MKSDIPKQFIQIGGKPILMHSINAFFHYCNDIEIIITLPKNQISEWEKLQKKHLFNIKHSVVTGGDTRFQSVKNALKNIETSSLVAIHDGVRPFVSTNLIDNGFKTAEKFGSAIPILPVTDSIRIMENDYPAAIDRKKIFSVQTPQVFHSEKIIKAYHHDFLSEFTDDGSVYESEFGKINAYDGIKENIKITNPMDIEFAQAIFNQLSNNSSFPHLLR